MIIHRRSLLTGLVSLLAAPAIVRVANLMPVKSMHWPEENMLFMGLAPLKTEGAPIYWWDKMLKSGMWRGFPECKLTEQKLSH